MSQWLDGVHRDEETFCGYHVFDGQITSMFERSFSVTWIKNTANEIWQLPINKSPHCMPFKTGLFGVCENERHKWEFVWIFPLMIEGVARIRQGHLHAAITN